MNAIPGLTNHTEDMLRVLGAHYVAPWYGQVISVVFGFLLLSAVNTSIGDLVSIQFLMAKDGELPSIFSRLNRYGMPALALVLSTLVPALVLAIEHDLVHLAALYAIGVIGAITLNLGACATNLKIPLKWNERVLLLVTTVVLFFIEVTIAYQKRGALIFALTVMTVGLILRAVGKSITPVAVPAMAPTVTLLTVSEAVEISPLYASSSLVALKNLSSHLLDEAALRITALGESAVYLSYVEETPPFAELPELVEPSPHARTLLEEAQKEMEKRNITAIPVWQLGENPGKLIAYAAKQLAVKTVMIGTTKRSALVSLLRGDVLKTLAHHLPKECHLVISG